MSLSEKLVSEDNVSSIPKDTKFDKVLPKHVSSRQSDEVHKPVDLNSNKTGSKPHEITKAMNPENDELKKVNILGYKDEH